MNRIADEAQVARATIYRHFPTREDLWTAVRDRATRQMLKEFEAADPERGDPVEALERLMTVLFRLRIYYQALFVAKILPNKPDRALLFAYLLRVFERARDEGYVAADVDLFWMVTALRGLFAAAREEVEAGHLSIEAAAQLVANHAIWGGQRPVHPDGVAGLGSIWAS